MKKTISLILTLTLLFSCIGLFNVTAVETDYSKFDEALKEKFETMSDDDTVDVSVWFTDIDYADVGEEVVEEINEKVDNGEMDEVAFDILSLSNASTMSQDVIEQINNVDQNLTVDEVNDVISIKRDVASLLYKDNNELCLSSFLTDEEIENSTIYISHYAPNALLTLNKE
ncbi:MAG: hypothetical protein LUF33_05395 [Clostridiales bacterium]|nr:hypothetical protein [Clostridiales bacterium]